MSPSRELTDILNEHTANRFWQNPPVHPTFQQVLDQYAIYSANLKSNERETLSSVFWNQIKKIGTPVIENNPQKEGEAFVYFLLPKDELKNKNDPYMQGEFHGYGGIKPKNKLDDLAGIGFYRCDSIPINAVVTYQYQQEGASLNDNNTSHRNVYHGWGGSYIFRVNPDPKQSHLGTREKEGYWEKMISAKTDSGRNFRYETTLYSDATNRLKSCDAKLPTNVDIYNPNIPDVPEEDFSTSPYANFTRAIHIFKPSSTPIEHVIVVNDGRPYILAGIMDHAEEMVRKNQLPPNTAFVCIDPIRGLAKTAPGLENDPRFILPGMGIRMIDFETKIDNYIIFLEKLFPQLQKIVDIPDDPAKRVMVGSSLSGTASVFIALEKPRLFSGVIAQSPSPSNDIILQGTETKKNANIQLSCGIFEQPRFNDTDTDCFAYAHDLGHRLSLPVYDEVYHGHNPVAWIDHLSRSLPIIILKANHNEITTTAKLTKGLGITSSLRTQHEEAIQAKTNVNEKKIDKKEPSDVNEEQKKQSKHSAYKTPTPFSKNLTKK